jgi:hypothetical protein
MAKEERKQNPAQVLRGDGKNVFFEVMATALPIGKVCINFRGYGSNFVTTNSVDFYFDVLQAAALGRQIVSGQMQEKLKKSLDEANGGYGKMVYQKFGGLPAAMAKRQDGKAFSRQFRIEPSTAKGNACCLIAESGAGKEAENGLIAPDYKKAENFVRIPISEEMFFALGEALLSLKEIYMAAKFGTLVQDEIAQKAARDKAEFDTFMAERKQEREAKPSQAAPAKKTSASEAVGAKAPSAPAQTASPAAVGVKKSVVSAPVGVKIAAIGAKPTTPSAPVGGKPAPVSTKPTPMGVKPAPVGVKAALSKEVGELPFSEDDTN